MFHFRCLRLGVAVLAVVVIHAHATTVAEEESGSRSADDSVAVHGIVVDGSDQPVVGASVVAQFGSERITRATDSKGHVAFEIPSESVQYATLVASAPDGTVGFLQIPPQIEMPGTIPVQRIKLELPRVIATRVVTRQGKPVEGAKVVVIAHYHTLAEAKTDDDGRTSLAVPKGVTLQFVLAEVPGKGVDYFMFRRPGRPVSDPYQLPQDHSKPITLTLAPTRSLNVRAADQSGNPLAGAQLHVWYVTLPKKGGHANLGAIWLKQADDNGIARFDIPIENEGKLTFWVQKDGYVAEGRTMVDARSAPAEVTATMLQLVPVTGRVLHQDGSPAEGIEVRVCGEGFLADGYRETTVTSKGGAFRFDAHPNKYCVFVAGNSKWASPAVTRVVCDKRIDGIELKLQRATRVFGRLTVGDGDKPIANAYLVLSQKASEGGNSYYALPEEERLPNPTAERRSISPSIGGNAHTNDAGDFEFFVGPGHFRLFGPRGTVRSDFEITNQKELEINLHSKRLIEGVAKGRVVLKSNPKQGVAEVRITAYADDIAIDRFVVRATSDTMGNFQLRRAESAQLVGAFSEDHKLGAIVRTAPKAESIVMMLQPTATVHGILIDEETGKPAVDREISASVRSEDKPGGFMDAFRRTSTTDEAGRFSIAGVVPGSPYAIGVVIDRDSGGLPWSRRNVHEFTLTRPGKVELGKLRLPKPYKPPTIEDYIARVFRDQDDLSNRLARTLADAKLTYQQVLLVASDPKSDKTRQFFEARYARYVEAEHSKDLSEAFANYMIVGVDVGRKAFLRDRGIAVPNESGATFAILNPDGRLVVETGFGDLSDDGKLDRARLTELLNTRRVPLPDAAKLFSSALATASREDKRVLVQVSGPGCPPCILLSRYFDSQKELIAKDYVVVKIDRRQPHAEVVIGKLRPNSKGGIPWMVILSAAGKALVTSDGAEGNVGYPGKEASKAHFEHMLRTTRQRLSDAEIAQLLAGLKRDW